MPSVVCVTGMHRSGTSFVARVIQLLGVSLGDPDRLFTPGPDNAAGYFESRFVTELNDELLAHLKGAWDQPPVLDPGWERDGSLDPFRTRAADILDDAFGSLTPTPDIIGWKDPRLSLLLPFWRTVTPITTTLVVVRDPAEVAASLLRRNGIEAPQAALLWLRYLFSATSGDPSHLMLRHRDLFDDLRGVLASLVAHLGLAPPSAQVEEEARRHLDPSLRHHVAPDGSPTDDNPLVALAAEVWNGGEVDLSRVPLVVADGIGRGWVRPPVDGEALARTRAEVVALTERLRRRYRAAVGMHVPPSAPDPDP